MTVLVIYQTWPLVGSRGLDLNAFCLIVLLLIAGGAVWNQEELRVVTCIFGIECIKSLQVSERVVDLLIDGLPSLVALLALVRCELSPL